MPRNPLLSETTAENMIKILTGSDYEQARKLHEWAEQSGLKIEPRTGAKYYRIQYSTPKPKRSLFTIECNEKSWRVKANLYHLSRYSEVEPLSDSLKKAVTATRECTGCNSRCIKGSRFDLDSKKYFACIGSGHFFEDMDKPDWELLVRLLGREKEEITM